MCVVTESLTQQNLKAGFKIYMEQLWPENARNSIEEEAGLIIMLY